MANIRRPTTVERVANIIADLLGDEYAPAYDASAHERYKRINRDKGWTFDVRWPRPGDLVEGRWPVNEIEGVRLVEGARLSDVEFEEAWNLGNRAYDELLRRLADKQQRKKRARPDGVSGGAEVPVEEGKA